MRAEDVILGPVLSEKAVTLSASQVYSLKVNVKATKLDVKKALKQAFDVDVLDVNTSIVRGKDVRRARSKKGGAVNVRRPSVKRAFIRLKSGQELPLPVLATEEAAASTETK